MLATVAIALSACSQTGVENRKLETQDDSLAYAIGVDIYNNMKAQGGMDVDPILLAKGMIDAEEGNSVFADGAVQGYIMAVMSGRQEQDMKNEFKDVIDEGEKFLLENKEKEGVLTTESGLQYKILVMGEGEKPAATDKVEVHYHGTLLDGTVFDSSVEREESIQFNVNGVISGWIEGLQLMPVGSKFMFYLPYDLAYGSRGTGDVIKPFSTLIFEVELLSIVTE